MNTIETFYKSFQEGNASGMTACYHDNIVFSDPAFGELQGNRAKAMWHMLIERSNGAMTIDYSDVQVSGNTATAKWTAHYTYGPKKRKVVNHVQAAFELQDGKIIAHHDTFDMYTWSKQALGTPGLLLGWTGFMGKKIQQKTNGLLDGYIKRNNSKNYQAI
ncbi:nuclear transport factor 2 family protein [Dokdonia sp. LLG6352-1]|uniref:nuclear transport factor 2 family protein n=1 Tax=Dokdonia sp. LLG6352-1 TaxID=3160831 RepID=UPI00386A207F